MMNQLLKLFGDVLPFLEENTCLSSATRGKFLSILHYPQQKSYLMVELAITVDAGMPFVQATYNLEGDDGPLALTCYKTISALNAAARQAYYPNLRAVTSEISSGNSLIDDLVQHTKSCVQ